MEVIDRCISLFSVGKYQQCTELSDQLKGDNTYKGWIHSCNSVTTKFMTKHLEDNVTEELQKMFIKDLQDLVLEIRSAPISTNLLQIELSALYNIYYIILYGNFYNYKDEGSERLLAETLVRVVGLQNWKHCSVDDDITELMLVSLQQTNDDAILISLVYLCCLWSTFDTKDEKRTTDTLEHCSSLPSLKTSELPPILLLPVSLLLTGQQYTDSSSTHDMVYLMAGMTLFNSQHQKAREYMENVKSQDFRPYILYLLAYQDYKIDNYIEVLTRLSSLPHITDITCRMNALCCHLFGLALSKLGKHQSAIQKFQESLDHDFSFLLPLYNISMEYRSLGMVAPELESLNLLATALEDQDESHSSTNNKFTDLAGEITEELSRHQVLYLLACRCSQLQMYEDASQRYLDLLSYLTDSDKVESKPGNRSVLVPTLQTIYMEAIKSLHLAKNYSECVAVCDQLLSCLPLQYHNSSFSSHKSSASLPFQSDSEFCSSGKLSHIDSSRRKRLRSDESVDKKIDEMDNDLLILLYRADCFVFLEKIEMAITCLDKCSQRLPLAKGIQSLDSKQQTKRQRVDSAGDTAKSMFETVSDLQRLASTVYCHLGIAMAAKSQITDALHFLRLGLRLDPGNQDNLYNYCVLLLNTNRKDASNTWCHGRQIETTSDSFHLSSILKQRQKKLRCQIGNDYFQEKDVTVTTEVTNELMLKLDVICLNFLLSGNKR